MHHQRSNIPLLHIYYIIAMIIIYCQIFFIGTTNASEPRVMSTLDIHHTKNSHNNNNKKMMNKPSAYRKGQKPVLPKTEKKKLDEEAMKLHHKEIMDKKMLTVKNNLHMKNLYEENIQMQMQAQQQQVQQYQQTMQQVYAGQNIVLARAAKDGPPPAPPTITPQRKFSHDVISRLLNRKKKHGSVYLAKIHQLHEGLTIPKSIVSSKNDMSKLSKSPVNKEISSINSNKKLIKTSKSTSSKDSTSAATDDDDSVHPAHEILKKLMKSSKTYSDIHKAKTAAKEKTNSNNDKKTSQHHTHHHHNHHTKSSYHHSSHHKSQK